MILVLPHSLVSTFTPFQLILKLRGKEARVMALYMA
jgi:hypothetical protein